MSRGPAISPEPDHDRQWVFPWQPRKSLWIPKIIALGTVGTAFLVLISSVRIQVKVPEKLAPRKASVIYLDNGPESRALALRAREGGPFPSRFEPSQWQGLIDLEKPLMDAARYQPPPYNPPVPELPVEDPLPPFELAAKGQRFFPKHLPLEPAVKNPVAMILSPQLYPLAGITAAAIPRELPPFEPPSDPQSASNPWRLPNWRFLIRLNPDGSVETCISLEKGSDPTLETWLRKIRFAPPPAKSAPWISVGVEFTNQPANGTDPR